MAKGKVKEPILENPRVFKRDFPDELRPKTNKGNRRLRLASVTKFNAIKKAYKELLLGKPKSEIRDALTNDDYGIGKKYAENTSKDLVEVAQRLIMEDMEGELQNIRIGLMAKAYDVYSDAREHNDRTNAMSALNFISKITGALDPRYGQTNVQNITIDFKFDNDDDVEEYEEVNEC